MMMARDVVQELIDASAGERMHEQMAQNGRADGHRVRAGDRALSELNHCSRTHGDDVTLRARRIERLAQFPHGVDATVAYLVEVIDRGDDRTRARLRGEQRLRGVEDEQTGNANAIIRQPPHSDDSVLDERDLHDDLVRYPRELLAVLIHVLAVDRVRRDVDRRVDDAADILKLLALLALVLAKQRGSGHDTIEKTTRRCPRNIIEVGTREQDLHDSPR